jgi:hypothetical protein
MRIVRVKSNVCGNIEADHTFDNTTVIDSCKKETVVCENNLTVEIWYTDSVQTCEV